MPRKSPPEPRASRSGSYVHESQRHTERVVLRLPPDVAEMLDELRASRGMERSAYVARLVRMAAGIDPGE